MKTLNAIALTLALAAVACGPAAAPVPESAPPPQASAGLTAFPQALSLQGAGTAEVLAGQANVWDLTPDLGVADGGGHQFDRAFGLTVTPASSEVPTRDAIEAALWASPSFPALSYADLTFYAPGDADDGVSVATVVPTAGLGAPTEGAYAALLGAGTRVRLVQTVDLAGAVEPIDFAALYAATLREPELAGDFGATLRVRLLDPATGEGVATLLDVDATGAGAAQSLDVGFAGQRLTLVVELRTDGGGSGMIDGITLHDAAGHEFVANGGFETGTFEGWTVDVPQTAAHVATPRVQVGDLLVKRTFYTRPTSPWARWEDELTNPGAAPISARVVYTVRLGSQVTPVIYQPYPGTLASWDGAGSSRDVGVAYGSGTALYRSASALGATDGRHNVYVVHDVTVPGGGRVVLLHYAVMDGEVTGATATGVQARALGIDDVLGRIVAGAGRRSEFTRYVPNADLAATANFSAGSDGSVEGHEDGAGSPAAGQR